MLIIEDVWNLHRGGGRQGSLSANLRPADITEVLGFKPRPFGQKTEHEWRFRDQHGRNAAIWDFKGSRWSCCGDSGLLRELFGNLFYMGA